ncbi:hypothetical protein RvY_19271 [Ramazzottius varieornatus]|uniref:Cadherin domain-containing protein n=1 Tax=Ramazzottius varieornatus TaxID=947166 RepID=A0A1D1W8V8_RAMVA|nr:hypothetical protein RvY_19271 [Ramazzottius varieornatus]
MSQTLDVLIRLLVDAKLTMLTSGGSSHRVLVTVIVMVASTIFTSSAQFQSRQTSTGSVVTCSQALYTASINETAAIGTLVLTPTATNANSNTLVWSIDDTSLQKFTINPSTGAISVGSQLARSFAVGRSALEFTIKAADSVNPSQTCQSTVRINIIPVVAPSVPSTGSGSTTGFSQTSFTLTASNCAVGATVGQVGSGTTTGSGFTYSLTSPNTYFSISSTTGIITLLQIPPAGTYSLTATSISSSGVTTSVPVSITTTCNGFGTGTGTGSFPQSSYSFTVSSCLVGSTVGQVVVSFSSGLGNTYSLTSPNTYFSIQSSTGLITLLQIPPSGSYTVFVSTVSPLTGITSSVPVTITVSCNGGIGTTGVTFTQSPYTFTLTTCSLGSFVGSVTGFSTTGGILTYSLLTPNQYFTINPTTGLITTIQIPPTGATQSLLVQATSSTGQTGVASVSVLSSCANTGSGTGTALTPTFTNSNYQFTVTSCTPGAFIGQVSAISPNGGTVTYSVNNGNGIFSVDPTSGLITSLSTPTIGIQTFYVQATSSLGGTAIAPVTITTSCNGINNGINNGGVFSGIVSQGTVPIFNQPYYTFTVTSCTAGTSVGQVFASPGLGTFPTIGVSTPILYSIDNGNPYYTINPTTGQITQSAVPVGTSQTLTVRAQTINGYTSSVPLTITSSCSGSQGTAAYTFTSSSCTPGSVIGQITSVASTGTTPTYSLVGSNSLFAISPTGQITAVGQQVSGTQTFQVLATTPDGGSATASVTVTSTCTGTSPSNAPLAFGQSLYTFIASSCNAGSNIGQVTVGSNPTGGTLTYTLQGGNNQFSINPITGSILAATTLTGGTASFTVTAVSSTGQSGSATVTVTSNCGSNIPTIGAGYPNTGYPNNYGPLYGPTYGNNQPTYPSGGGGGYSGNYEPAPYANPGYNTVPIGPIYGGPSGPNYGGGSAYRNTASYGSGAPYAAGSGAYAGGNFLTSRSMPPQFRQPVYSCSLPCSATDVQRACILKASNAAQDTITYTLNPSDKFEMDPNTGEIRTIGFVRIAGTYQLTASAADPFGGTTTVPVTLTVTGSC